MYCFSHCSQKAWDQAFMYCFSHYSQKAWDQAFKRVTFLMLLFLYCFALFIIIIHVSDVVLFVSVNLGYFIFMLLCCRWIHRFCIHGMHINTMYMCWWDRLKERCSEFMQIGCGWLLHKGQNLGKCLRMEQFRFLLREKCHKSKDGVLIMCPIILLFLWAVWPVLCSLNIIHSHWKVSQFFRFKVWLEIWHSWGKVKY